MNVNKNAALSLVELLIVLCLLLVLLTPVIHVYLLTSRGMRNSSDELEATQLCLRVLEGLRSLPFDEIPGECEGLAVTDLPDGLAERIGWKDVPGFELSISIETRHSDVDAAAVERFAPAPGDPRRELLARAGEMRVVHVRCSKKVNGGGRGSIAMSTVIGRIR